MKTTISPKATAPKATTPATVAAPEFRLVDENEAAAILGVSVAFLKKDRLTARRIPYASLSRRLVRYPLSGLQAFVEANMVGGAASV